MEDKTFTVSEINKYINRILKGDPNLKNIQIKGEISNYKTFPSGHSYFTLKDETSQIPAVFFKFNKDRFLDFEPENGMKVIIKGKIEVYENDGKYQLYVTKIQKDGIGDLFARFEQLKKDLDKEGLFKDTHKKEIPKYPQRIGVVTAQTGAAIRDIITTIKRRYPICEILVFSTLVQGSQAAPQIVRQIKHAQEFNIDTLIVGRGGGSIEDLWPFNEEIVAREIYACKIPVISAVGHEIDFTIADFVADKRAATPTAAAELAVPSIQEVKNNVDQLSNRINKSIEDKLLENKTKLEYISQKNVLKNPETIYEIKGMRLDSLISRLDFSSKNIISQNRTRLFKLENSIVLKKPEEIIKAKREAYLKNFNKLEVLNPLLTLKRGYTMAKSGDKVISSAKDVKVGDEIDIEFNDGTVNTRVI
ncbi:exodeoxyribonuclease VII large subunit [Methanobrevibacter sp.]|uniref:exodeoxyribonuclease VII large subunit n=1 Tax=Methanobrevibacter sp. TaxID=66852 RepID=UPI0025F0C95B|nr:exodeoxyribonuclease VII large subunit [Methanobrevibacter sp.]MBR4446945.1 exodeoxyribonuclease VII large subunit [Methanobrevibacter sp.]